MRVVAEGESFGAHRPGQLGCMCQVTSSGLGRGVENVVEAAQVAAEQLDLECRGDQGGQWFQECCAQRNQRQHGAQRELAVAHQVRAEQQHGDRGQ